METSHKNHRAHIKMGKDAEEEDLCKLLNNTGMADLSDTSRWWFNWECVSACESV